MTELTDPYCALSTPSCAHPESGTYETPRRSCAGALGTCRDKCRRRRPRELREGISVISVHPSESGNGVRVHASRDCRSGRRCCADQRYETNCRSSAPAEGKRPIVGNGYQLGEPPRQQSFLKQHQAAISLWPRTCNLASTNSVGEVNSSDRKSIV